MSLYLATIVMTEQALPMMLTKSVNQAMLTWTKIQTLEIYGTIVVSETFFSTSRLLACIPRYISAT